MHVRRALGAPGAGHLGTLDPPATGLLLVAVGAATRCLALWQGGEKTYEVTLRFGVETATDDLAGEVVARRDVEASEEAIRAAALAFSGDTLQVPPMVSAIKVQGRRLHALARAGHTVERAPRPVHVAEWTWLEFRLPEARARIRCSGGTYVRALVRDLGAALGCGAAVAELRRLRSEPFGLDPSVTLDDLRAASPAELWSRGGIPLALALASLPSLEVAGSEVTRLGHGNPFPRPAREAPAAMATPMGEVLVLVDAGGEPLALAERRADPGDPAVAWLQPRVVFPWAVAADGR